jgi:hypothetical protein
MRKILDVLSGSYPGRLGFVELQSATGVPSKDLDTDLHYLAGHGLIDVTLWQAQNDPCRDWTVRHTKITESGLDFIMDDGGLSAILGVVTVKLHEETIRALLLSSIESQKAPEAEKSALREAIKKAPTTAFNEVVKSLVGVALRDAPSAFGLLKDTFLSHL